MESVVSSSLPSEENRSSSQSTAAAENKSKKEKKQQQQNDTKRHHDSSSPPRRQKQTSNASSILALVVGAKAEMTSTTPPKKKKKTTFTPVDMDVLRGLDSDFAAAQKETAIGEQARRAWAFRAATFSIFFIAVYMTLGILFFRSQTDWGLPDTILFAVYSATSAGFGHLDIPQTALFQMVDVVYILIGIASLAIMVAQVYQYLQLEASRAEDNRRAAELASTVEDSQVQSSWVGDVVWSCIDRIRPFFKNTQLGRFLSVFLPLTVIVLTGACAIGAIEGWTFLECVYFGVVSLTTTGYGDYYPTKTPSILICAVWLPCNIIFTSIYMGSVATWYLDLSAKGIRRIRSKLHAKQAEIVDFNRSISSPDMDSRRIDLENGLTDYPYEDGDDSAIDAADNYGYIVDGENNDDNSEAGGSQTQTATKSTKSSENGTIEDQDVDALEDDIDAASSPMVVFENMASTLTTMADVITAVETHNGSALLLDQASAGDAENGTTTESLRFMSLQPANDDMPCFTLRVLVKQRLAAIIARDLAGGDHNVEVQDSFIVFRIGQWKDVVAKWLIPRGAWKAFRAAALDAMMLVGERPLIQQGPDALFQLSPDEFHSIFSPLVAAMGDAVTLQGWLNSTDKLAVRHLADNNALTIERLEKKLKKKRRLRVDDDEVQMPKSQGTAFHK